MKTAAGIMLNPNQVIKTAKDPAAAIQALPTGLVIWTGSTMQEETERVTISSSGTSAVTPVLQEEGPLAEEGSGGRIFFLPDSSFNSIK